jgi:hypothetical protein
MSLSTPLFLHLSRYGTRSVGGAGTKVIRNNTAIIRPSMGSIGMESSEILAPPMPLATKRLPPSGLRDEADGKVDDHDGQFRNN